MFFSGEETVALFTFDKASKRKIVFLRFPVIFLLQNFLHFIKKFFGYEWPVFSFVGFSAIRHQTIIKGPLKHFSNLVKM
ncbi:hypothetical protein A3B59_01125 [Candidatus Beckwithbacteria bacterium RIFCSPLOWO2_01_FULL_49_47]|nr:MAG: hypothetical protein A2877_03410 [Candidatus Beckwithbacteria bacterium RIFCSPHIGHO2_01_FULL_49_39]OGD50198.1 MAG: hypothetical protein A3K56_00705 [Candidatus Beckwithbacteria bacterium RIFCSPHIGHO2_12_FULL_49_13]OGD51300.1 MAG: hypothetical protein A3D86_03570 [Candidatus Beckwithbacteria bacterium RIFCSPHIGHO2_02_FULL_49_13]OGD60480.1 MAG: hypothetical protein A3B59_01125 [Candidatus Beckwithbacteria bacterium RIFCSPLOWO2_01_FULL_49_47]